MGNKSKHVFVLTTTEALSENCSHLCVKPSEHVAVSVCWFAAMWHTEMSVTAGVVVLSGVSSTQALCSDSHATLSLADVSLKNASRQEECSKKRRAFSALSVIPITFSMLFSPDEWYNVCSFSQPCQNKEPAISPQEGASSTPFISLGLAWQHAEPLPFCPLS